MIKLKDLLTEEVASKSEHKKMEKLSDDILKQMDKLNDMFKKVYKPSTGNSVLYNTMRDWKEIRSEAYTKYGGWFDFAKTDKDYVS